MTGAGRLAETDAIVAAVVETLDAAAAAKNLEGRTVLITAGPTQEEIDPVRYITNRSSGRMGYALAEAAAQRGANVVLISGPTALSALEGVEMVAVRSSADMSEAVLSRLGFADIVIMAAAVADYRPAVRASQKIKKQEGSLNIELEATRDILQEIGRRGGTRFVVGFAAETEDLIENARKKLQGKNLDMIVANDVSGSDTGFDSEFNAAVLLSRDGQALELPRMTKHAMAGRILDEVALRLASPVIAS